MRLAGRILGRAVVAAALSAPAGAAGGNEKNPYTGDAEAIAEGKRLWADTGCYACHGADAGGAVGPDLTDDEWVYRPTDATIFKAIARGRRGTTMVGWSDSLDDDQIWKVVAYIRSLYKGDPEKIIW